ncbi:NAD(P)-binding Rossmann-fold superfamily protein [Actinidia rufa]|uniref:NAD(P)-binding Rossmann-fold superfamily protein n=1 Tax=Actinidia rufa TaxID=165716 RepID=A0A7J0G5U3_9ERIC|nr:NAD(P)-binding Rossmann-fold superfamily protein [Actinidia rufa]
MPQYYNSRLILQGDSSSVGRRFSRKNLRPGQLSSPLSKPFLQLNDRFQPLVYQHGSSFYRLRTYKRAIYAEAGKQGWDLGRFVKTLYFFNGPPSPVKFFEFLMEKLSSPAPSEPVTAMDSPGIVLVSGATGGVGRRVVNILRSKGFPVRVLVRNKDKARNMLGPDVDMNCSVIFLSLGNALENLVTPEKGKGLDEMRNIKDIGIHKNYVHIRLETYLTMPEEISGLRKEVRWNLNHQVAKLTYSQVVGDITKESTLVPEYFKGVKNVINAVSVIVGPKEGDTPDRAKYSQIKGDSPEMVEYIGMKNLINAVKGSIGLRSGKLLFGFEGNSSKGLAWGALDDVVMGGVSESSFQIDPIGGENGGPTGMFKGVVSTANNGGFASIRTKNFPKAEDLSAYDGLELRLKGDGRRYKLIVRTSRDWDTVGYTSGFDTVKGQWQSLMFSKFEYDGKLNPTFVEGAFQLPVSSIRSYIKDPITPRFVHVSSAGVTRPDRPGLDLSKQPPAVRLNKELDFILTFKLKGEDLIRESEIPYTIVRPCALTEEPAGADLIFDQGDNITGKISREEIARICVAALESPYACDKTFEVKSVVPFSEPYTVDPENPPPEKDYNVYFKTLKDGITGKEILEQSPVPV